MHTRSSILLEIWTISSFCIDHSCVCGFSFVEAVLIGDCRARPFVFAAQTHGTWRTSETWSGHQRSSRRLGHMRASFSLQGFVTDIMMLDVGVFRPGMEDRVVCQENQAMIVSFERNWWSSPSSDIYAFGNGLGARLDLVILIWEC